MVLLLWLRLEVPGISRLTLGSSDLPGKKRFDDGNEIKSEDSIYQASIMSIDDTRIAVDDGDDI